MGLWPTLPKWRGFVPVLVLMISIVVIWLDLVIVSMQKTMIAQRSCANSTNHADGLDQIHCYLCPVPKALIAMMGLCPCTLLCGKH